MNQGFGAGLFWGGSGSRNFIVGPTSLADQTSEVRSSYESCYLFPPVSDMCIWGKDDSDYDYDNEETYAHRAHILMRMSNRLRGETDYVVLAD